MLVDWAVAILAIGLGASVLLMSWAMVVGALGVLAGERFERCPHCHHYSLTLHGEVHPGGCPVGASRHLIHLLAPLSHLHIPRSKDGIGLGHH